MRRAEGEERGEGVGAARGRRVWGGHFERGGGVVWRGGEGVGRVVSVLVAAWGGGEVETGRGGEVDRWKGGFCGCTVSFGGFWGFPFLASRSDGFALFERQQGSFSCFASLSRIIRFAGVVVAIKTGAISVICRV